MCRSKWCFAYWNVSTWQPSKWLTSDWRKCAPLKEKQIVKRQLTKPYTPRPATGPEIPVASLLPAVPGVLVICYLWKNLNTKHRRELAESSVVPGTQGGRMTTLTVGILVRPLVISAVLGGHVLSASLFPVSMTHQQQIFMKSVHEAFMMSTARTSSLLTRLAGISKFHPALQMVFSIFSEKTNHNNVCAQADHFSSSLSYWCHGLLQQFPSNREAHHLPGVQEYVSSWID